MKKTKQILKISLIVFFLLKINLTYSQLVVTPITPEEAIQNVLLGDGVTATNITFKGKVYGANASIGKFIEDVNAISSPFSILDSGIIICTGKATDAPGAASLQRAINIDTNIIDAELTAITTNPIQDGFVLEFDFIPTSDSISFDYIFASEEYPEYANTTYNDVFGFFLTGPDPNSTGTLTNFNIAIIPGTNLPVTINNLNNGTTNAGPCEYCQYYVNNSSSTTVAYDGSTTVLTAKAKVKPCKSYHIKLGVADVGDGSHDSGVFLKARSFKSKSSSKEYEPCEDANIYGFRIPNQLGFEIITSNTNPGGIVVKMPAGTNVTALVPSIIIKPGATISPESGVARDFTGSVLYTVTSGSGLTTKDWKVNVNYGQGITTNEIGNISIYPNPTNGNFTLNVDQKYTMTIFDATGREVIARDVEMGTNQIDLTSNKTGVYFLRLINDKEVQTIRLVKE